MQASTLATQSAPFDLPGALAEIQAQAQELAARFAQRHREVRLHPFEHGELHPELWSEICERGWAGLLVPGEHGGREGGLLAYVLIMEALAARNLILWMPVLTDAIGYAIAQVGPEHARDRWLERIASGETFLALAVTEPQCGHNVFRSTTTVRREDDRFVVNGLRRSPRGSTWPSACSSSGVHPTRRARPRSSRPCSSTRTRPESSARSCRCAGARARVSSS
jgi:alkylation response protein AidB-like acyl-CoA dehydrogenase